MEVANRSINSINGKQYLYVDEVLLQSNMRHVNAMRSIAYLGRVAAGIATILETYTTTGASADVSHISTP